MKKAIITGITGQDGAYLAQLLLENNYLVYGTYAKKSSLNTWRLEELDLLKEKNLHLMEYDLRDQESSRQMMQEIEPDEIYNLAAQSSVSASFEKPLLTAQTTALGCINLLEAIRIVNPKIRFYQASTSEMFGKAQEVPQTENTPFYPRSPYGVAKQYAHWMSINYRESYGIFVSCGILYNHESPLRGLNFVTRKITDSAVKIKLGKLDILELGNLNAERDWGYAKDYVKGMYQMLQVDKPDCYILATQKTHSVREFVTMSFKVLGINLEFQGHNENEIAIDKATGKTLVKVNPSFYRPCEVELLVGNAQKAKEELGWQAECQLEELCNMMIKEDMKRNKAIDANSK